MKEVHRALPLGDIYRRDRDARTHFNPVRRVLTLRDLGPCSGRTAISDDSCILGLDSDDAPVVEGQDEKDVLALMGSVLSHKLSHTMLTLFKIRQASS